jgi:hypothetical protein
VDVELGQRFQAGAFEDGRVKGAEFFEGGDEVVRHAY